MNENCETLKAKLRLKYNIISEQDLQCTDGKKEEMLSNLRLKLGKTSSELRDIIINLS